MPVYNRAFGWLLAFLFVSASVNQALAQPEIPGVTDITSVTNVLTKDAAGFIWDLKKACQDSTYFVRQVQDFRGTVDYRDDLKSYVISSGLPDVIYTPDTMVCGQWTGIVCNWTQAGHWVGKIITFSGRYFQARGVMPRYGGEHIFYLHVTAVR